MTIEELERVARAFAMLDLTCHQAHVLTTIALHDDDDGVTVKELVDHTGMGQATLARVLGKLGNENRRGKSEPLRLVEVYPDPEERRRYKVRLSRKGRAFLNGLLS